MNLKIVFWIFSLLFLFACNTDNSNLKAQIADLEKKLQEATDPETIANLQKEIIEKQRKKGAEMKASITQLEEDLKQTKDKESCERIVGEIQEIIQSYKEFVREFHLSGAWWMGGGKRENIKTTIAQNPIQSNL